MQLINILNEAGFEAANISGLTAGKRNMHTLMRKERLSWATGHFNKSANPLSHCTGHGPSMSHAWR